MAEKWQWENAQKETRNDHKTQNYPKDLNKWPKRDTNDHKLKTRYVGGVGGNYLSIGLI